MSEHRIKVALDWIVDEEDYASAESLARYYANEFAEMVLDDSTATGQPVYAVSGSATAKSIELEEKEASEC